MKMIIKAAAYLLVAVTFSGCATVFGGPVTEYQRTKPLAGQPQRAVRAGALVADIILFWPGAIVDFATGAIYKPQPMAKPAPEADTSLETTGQ